MPESDLSLLIDAARASGDIARRHFQRSHDVWDKPGGAGPVTEADLEIDRMLRAELLSARPDYGWLSEETEDDSARLGKPQLFIVDPIDGTRAFIDGSRDFAHSLAVAEGGRVTAAAVYLPLRDMLFTASREEVARLNDAPIAASPVGIDGAQVLAARPNLDPQHWPGGLPPVERHFRSSLAYRMCLVAQGRFDGMLTLRPTWEWDVAAGCLIVERAGGVATDRAGQPARFNNANARLNGVVAGGASVHAGLVERLSQ